MSTDLTAGIVRVLNSKGVTAGTGFVVTDDGHIATCAHVVEGAGAEPGDTLRIVFHATGEEAKAETGLDWWRVPDAEDVAILRLAGTLPDGVKPLPLGSSAGVEGHTLTTFGFPDATPVEGMAGKCEVVGRTTQRGFPVLQLRSSEVTPGFSGAPVLDSVTRRVVGMVTAITVPDQYGRLPETAFMTPTETLRAVCSALKLSDLCPYKSLAAFGEADAEFFCGREALVTDLVDHLRRNPRFLAVVGPSGSGKSSVVQAGLFPALRRGDVPGSGDWRLLSFRPGDNPFAALTAAGLDVSQMTDLQAVVRAFLKAHPQVRRLVLFADQFEELFALCSEQVQERFLDQLLTLLESELPITVALALRADFYGYLLRHKPLVDRLKVGQVNVPPMGLEELKAAVEEPALKVGLRFEPGLVETIVGEAGEAEHPLPLLESALTQLWEKREDGTLTRAAYQALGHVAGAIGQWAEDTFSGLPPGEQSLARRVFTRLVHYGEGEAADTRQRRSLSELMARPEERETLHRLVRQLADARLLVTGGDPLDVETVEIIHDALLREWGRLRRWMTEQREFYMWRQRLDERLREWEKQGRDEGALLHGTLLVEAERWLVERTDELNPDEREYIQESIALREREREAEKRRRQRIVWGLAGGLLAALVLAVAAGLGWQSSATNENALETQVVVRKTAQADTENEVVIRKTAQARVEVAATAEAKAHQIALSGQWAVQAINQLNDNNWRVALLLAIEAGRRADTVEAFTALREALPHLGRTLFTLSDHTDAVWNTNGSRILTASDDGTARVWDAQTGKEQLVLSGHTAGVYRARWNADGSRILTASSDGTARVWDVITGRELLVLSSQTGQIRRAVWNADGHRILTVEECDQYSDYECLGSAVRVWDVVTGAELLTLTDLTGRIRQAEWNADESRILTIGHSGGVLQVWDSGTGDELFALSGHTGDIFEAVWSHDNIRILTSSFGGTVQVWDTETGEELLTFSGHIVSVYQALWSTDGSRILTAGCDVYMTRKSHECRQGTVQVWDATTGIEILSLSGYSAMWNADASRILTIGYGGKMQIWNMETGEELRSFSGHAGMVHQAVWNADSSRILTVGCDRIESYAGPEADRCLENSARVWDVVTGAELLTLADHTDWISQAAWDANGNRILTSSGSTVRVWDAQTKTELPAFSGHTNWVRQPVWNADGSRILTTSGEDDTARVWDAGTGEELLTLSGHMDWVSQAVWNADESRILTASGDDTARVWDAGTGEELFILSGHTEWVRQAVWNADENLILTASDDGTARVWDAQTGKELITLPGHEGGITKAVWNRDENHILTISSGGTAWVWDALIGKELLVLSDPTGGIDQAEWNADSSRILTVSSGGTARVWDAQTGAELFTLSDHTDGINQAMWNADSSRILTASSDGTMRVWDTHTGVKLLTFSGHTDSVYQAVWNANSSLILTTSNDGTARVWNARTGSELLTLSGLASRVLQATWNADESRVLTVQCVRDSPVGTCMESTVQVWDMETGAELFTFFGSRQQAWWNVNGSRILISDYNTMHQWYTQMDDLLEVACRRTPRNMSQDEWRRFMKHEPYRETCPDKFVPDW